MFESLFDLPLLVAGPAIIIRLSLFVARGMKTSWPARVLVFLVLPLTAAGMTQAQTSDSAKEFWPTVKATIELRPKTRVQLYTGKQNGEDLARTQWTYGVMGSYRMKRLVQVGFDDIDDEKNHILTLGAGFEYLRTNDDDSVKTERRIVVQGTPTYLIPGTGLHLQDRNRIEFRWVNGAYSTRYRNKLTVQRSLKLHRFSFTPYSMGELFHDGKSRSWNENQYGFGVIFPYKKLLSLDSYFVHQNCTTCKEPHVNALGLTLNIFVNLKKK
jgi:hypothetical protein